MASIICWNNASEDWYPGVWAVADSRVSSSVELKADSVQRLFILPVNLYESLLTKENSKRILSVCYGFAGSTLIGNGVKDILSLCLDNLVEVIYYEREVEVARSIEERTPSFDEIAELAKK